jgi:hypothetical protein
MIPGTLRLKSCDIPILSSTHAPNQLTSQRLRRGCLMFPPGGPLATCSLSYRLISVWKTLECFVDVD